MSCAPMSALGFASNLIITSLSSPAARVTDAGVVSVMPAYECPDCGGYVVIGKNAVRAECRKCLREVKVVLNSSVNYDGKPVGFVHYKEDRVTTRAEVYLDLETLMSLRRGSDVNKSASPVVS